MLARKQLGLDRCGTINAPMLPRKPDNIEEISPLTSTLDGGPYRARTDDIHGVNVALYQLS
jgi:hypothetical protein